MNKNRRTTLIVALAMIVLIGGALVAYRTLAPGTTAVAPQEAPSQTATSTTEAPATESEVLDEPRLADFDATVYDEDGTAHKLTELAGERPLVLNFWATWCPFCVDEMPDFKEIYAEFGDRVSFAFIDVTDGRRETKEAAVDWLLQNDLQELPAYFDTDLDATTVFAARSLPTTVIIAGDGEILSASAGRIDPTLVRANLSSLT